MSLRKSFIEIGWKIDKSGLTTANQETTKMIKKWESALGSIDAYNKRIKQLEAQQGKLTTQVDKTTKAQENSTDQVKKTTDEVERSTKASERQQAATQRHTQAVQKSATHMQSLGNSMQSVGRSASALSLGIGAGFIYSANQASKLQNQYKIITNLATTGGEKSAEAQRNVNKMQNDGAKYSQKYGVAQKQISSGYEELIRRGYTSNQALAAQKTFLQGAIASGDDYTDVVHNSTAAIEAFGLKSNNTAQMTKNTKLAVNQMAYAADLTATDFQGMGYAMTYVGSTAHSADQSLGQTASAIGVLSNAGQEASVAGTGLRKVLNSLASPGPKSGIPALKSIGLAPDDLRDSNGKLKSMSSIFDLLNSKLKGKSRKEKFDFFHTMFGTTGQTSAMILSQNAKQLGSLNEQVKKAQNQKGGGYIANLSGKNMQTFQVQLQRFKQTALNSGIEMSKTFLPAATRILEKVTDLMQSFNKLPKPVRNFAATGALITAAFGPALIIVGKMVSAVGVLKGAIASPKLVSALTKVGPLSGLSKGAVKVSAKATEKALPEVGSQVAMASAKTGLKGIASKIPYLDVAMAGTSLIGMNKKNAGKKVGKFGGTLAGMEGGATIGSLAGPIGTIIGGAVGAVGGGALGSKVGSWAQKQLPGIKKSLSSFFSGIGKWAGKQWKSIGKFFGGIGSWFKGVGKGLDKNIVKPVSKAFTSVVTTAKRWGGKVKNAMLTPFYFLVGAGHRYIVKPLQKPVTEALSWVSKKWKAFSKTASKLWKSISGSMSKAFTKGINAIKKIAGAIGGWLSKKWRGISKVAGQIWSAVSSAVSKPIIKGVNVVKNVWKGATTWLSKTWSGLTGIASTVFSAVGNAIKKPIGVAWSYISGIFDKIKTAVKGVVDKVGGVVNGVKNWASGLVTEGKHVTGHATGGKMLNNHTALVGEGGPELAYKVNGASPRLYGANGPQFARVRAGERILNARDTAKVLSGGLGTGMVLKGYAGGTAKLKTSSVKTKVASFSKPSTKGIDSISKAYAKTTKKSNQSIQSFNKTSSKLWSTNAKSAKSATSQMSKTTTKNFTTLKNNATKQLDQTQNNGVTQMKQMHSGMNAVAKDMTADFYKIMSKLKGYAHSAMAGAISSLNGGISGINTVLNKFGGGGNVLPAIHYATGTGGPITRHTMAVVNDAKSGPRQETIVKPNGRAFMPQGNDTVVPLEPGDEVLNGHDTQSLQAMGALPHFAKGTTGLADLISKNNSHPDQAYAKDFTGNLKGKLASNDLSKDIAKASGKATDGVGKPWYSTVWSVLNDAKSGGSAAGGNWRHDPGMGETNGFGAARSFGSHDGVDFSSSLGSTILAVHGGTVTRVGKPVWGASQLGDVITVKSDDGWQEIYQEFGTMKNIKVAVGDIIKTGQAIATLGPLNGAGSGAHVHIGVAHGSLWDHGGSSTRGWFDVTKMKGTSNGSPKQKASSKKDSALTKLVKSELGSKVKWVTKNLSDEIGDVGSLGISGSVASRAKILAAAIKKAYPSATNAGIAAVLGNWEFESGLNPGAINPGGGASGLGQWLGGRKTNLINYARKHNQNWKNAGAQLDFALHGDGSDSNILKRILSGTGSVAALANQFSSQWERGGYNAQHVAGARKIESMLATGGRTPASGFSLVGEKGPELVQFDQPATVRSADKTRQMLTANSTKVAGNKTIHNTFNIKVNVTGGDDAKATGKSVSAAVRDELAKLFSGELDNLAY